MPIERFAPNSSALADKLAALRALAPEAFTADGQLDWDALRTALGDAVDDHTPGFGLRWPGKRAAQRAAHTPVRKTMSPAAGHGVDEASTHNFLIEGDNLDALKLLRKAYHKRVKMIYIDPPYNTGNDFVYKDDFAESAESFQTKTGAVDAEGARLVANPKSNGRFHSNWLDMIFPRLLLARELLRDDGVIFVSIDDNEVHNLRHVMDEVFGPENFFAQLVRRAMHTVRNSSKDFNQHADYILTYARDKQWFSQNTSRYIREIVDKSMNYPYDDGDGRGVYKLDPLYARNYYTPYSYTFSNGRVWQAPEGSYPRYAIETLKDMERENRIVFTGSEPKAKRYLAEVQEGQPPDTILSPEKVGFNSDGTKALREALNVDKVFSQPKPVALIKYLASLLRFHEGVILDFFAGSGTTAEAVLRLNHEDGGRRQFILVQLPEPTDNPAFPTIAEITKERIRRVCARLRAEPAALPLDPAAAPPDLGFKVLHVAESHFRTWPDLAADEDESAYQRTLDAALDDPLRAGWTPAGVLTEIALQEGFPLDAAFTPAPEFTRNAVVRISHPSLTQSLYVCLDARLFAATADAARALGPHDVFFCFDAALGDELKLQLADACRVKTI